MAYVADGVVVDEDVLEEVVAIYLQSKKRSDNFWTEWLSRPPAAVLVWMLRGSSVTPNQVSFLAIAIAAVSAAVLIGWRTHAGLVMAGLGLQLAYVVDCVDGQLARTKGQTSPAGALLDFMLDEVKAFLVLGSAAVSLYLSTDRVLYLIVGIVGLFACATGITLTSFMRRPEYLDAIGAPPIPPATDRAGFWPARVTPMSLVEAGGKLALHYPSWFLFICVFDRLDWFLWIYVTAHVLYLGRASLIVFMRLASPSIYRKKEQQA